MEPHILHNQVKDEIITLLESHIKSVPNWTDFLVLVETTICVSLYLITKDHDKVRRIFEELLIPGVKERLNEIKERQNV